MIVLTGGAGFIGSNILKKLNEEGHENIVVVDNLNSELKKKNLEGKKYAAYFDKNEFLEKIHLLQSITAIIHQGACSSTTETDQMYLQKNNVDYSKSLLRYSVENNIPFIYASSASVYGNGEKGFDDSSNDYTPINGYAQSKLLFDQYVTEVINNEKPPNPIVGLRYFNVYGNGEAHKQHMSSVIYKFYTAYQNGETIKLFEGSDRILRDFIYVDDVVSVNLFCLRKNLKNGIYNVGTGKAESFLKLAQVFQSYYPDAIIETIPFPEQLKNKYQYFTEARMHRLLQQGYNNSFTNSDKGVQAYLEKLQ
jgi:ADP-L-glycero-D-manno-heptose 6-epimerase